MKELVSIAFHNLTIEGGKVKLDDFEVKGVKSFIYVEKPKSSPILTIQLYVENDVNISNI